MLIKKKCIQVQPDSLVIWGLVSHRDSSLFREKRYDETDKGSYLLFFRCGKKLAVDATEDDGSLGRLINHSTREPNVIMKVHVVDSQPRVVFVATKEIQIGLEILYDYGERRKAILECNPWLKWTIHRWFVSLVLP